MSVKRKSVWETLSAIDCSGHTEDKNGFTYLAWSWAWETLKIHYPTARFEKHPVQHLPDGTAMLSCRVWIDDIEDVTEVFPVINYSNKSIQNPDAFQINTAYQRCLVKCLAYMGLGMYIYHGLKEHPEAQESSQQFVVKSPTMGEKEVPKTDLWQVAQVLMVFMEGHDLDGLRQYWAINKQPLEHLEKFAPDEYKEVFEAFQEMANELKEKEKKDG